MRALPHPIPNELAELIAERLRAIADPTRIRLLDRLSEAPATVSELVAQLGGTQQNISKHLGVLHRAGILSRVKEGTCVRYAVADGTVLGLCERVCGGVRTQLAGLDALLGDAGTHGLGR